MVLNNVQNALVRSCSKLQNMAVVLTNQFSETGNKHLNDLWSYFMGSDFNASMNEMQEAQETYVNLRSWRKENDNNLKLQQRDIEKLQNSLRNTTQDSDEYPLLANKLTKSLQERKRLEEMLEQAEGAEREGFEVLQFKTAFSQEQRRIYEEQARRLTLTLSVIGSGVTCAFTWYLTNHRFSIIRDMLAEERAATVKEATLKTTAGIEILANNLQDLHENLEITRHQNRLEDLRRSWELEMNKEKSSIAKLAGIKIQELELRREMEMLNSPEKLEESGTFDWIYNRLVKNAEYKIVLSAVAGTLLFQLAFSFLRS